MKKKFKVFKEYLEDKNLTVINKDINYKLTVSKINKDYYFRIEPIRIHQFVQEIRNEHNKT